MAELRRVIGIATVQQHVIGYSYRGSRGPMIMRLWHAARS